MTDPTIITLTAIPPRFADLGGPLRALLRQRLPAAEVRLYIPARYRRFPDWDGTLPQVPVGVTIHRTAQDFGPATKVLPAVRDLAGQAVDILFCDDDQFYDPHWHGRMKAARAAHPGAAIVEAGKSLPDMDPAQRPAAQHPRAIRREKGAGYRLRRAAGLGMWRPSHYRAAGHVDLLAGYGGAMVRPGFFDAAAFDIPDILWTVDDIWLSGQLARRGVPIWLNVPAPMPRPARAARQAPLMDHVEAGHGRTAADLAAIAYFRNTYGIWPPAPVKAAWQGNARSGSMHALFAQTKARLGSADN